MTRTDKEVICFCTQKSNMICIDKSEFAEKSNEKV